MATTTAQDEELASALVQTMHRLQDLHAESSRPLGLTPQQAHLLCVLLGGPLGMTELSRVLSIERSSLTSMVDRLERRDLVARTANPTDRRACHIELTTDGKSLAHDVHNAVVARIETLTADLSASTRKTLMTALQSILAQA
ncbi:MarR family winged helix-turn-helix transcriptional regulator [Kribbella kalugense]|uniref:DNA-binding MarR family transcriptional regulator n=1 Tax=Kribbella kalugense TaxID=2512221 RepID=A0A4R7ZIU9_9ACTN|nr:MarR family transcriptional regulator [Kribbella kalugense]TDW17205.1 DNA-binding MarR family transcriptional regulator [Kribbella kalugense]